MSVVEATGDRDDSEDLEALCHAGLLKLGANRITVWRSVSSTKAISPHLSVARPLPHSNRPSQVTLAGWALTPISDLPPFATALDEGRGVVVADPAHSGGRVAELAAETGAGSLYCRPLADGVAFGVLVIEPSEAASDLGALDTLDALTASATSWLRRRPPVEGSAALEFFYELAEATEKLPATEVLRLACQRVAQLLGVRRCSIFSEDDYGHVLLRVSEVAKGTLDEETWARMCSMREPFPLVTRCLSTRRPEMSAASSSELIGHWAEVMQVAAALAVPVGERGVLVLDHDGPFDFSVPQLRLVIATAAQLGCVTRSVRGRRERVDYEATSAALRQLLEAGVHACTPLEAAGALAAAAAKILGFTSACAYLIDDAGRITDVATVGAPAILSDALRAGLVGRLAADSPVWQRAVQGDAAAPDLVADTTLAGVVRAGGVAEVLGWRSLAAIPLLSSDGPLGLVLCGDSTPRNRWRTGDRGVLEQLALEGAVVVDNARLRQTERHEASHDALTGLLNRRAFAEQFRSALAVSARRREPLAVLVLDLDRFKEVNDHLGHHCGDQLLVEVGRRLRVVLREGDIIARMGGDEFALVLTSDGDRPGAEAVAAKLELALGYPMELGDHAVRIDASIGVALSTPEGGEVEDLLHHADLAMYAAKRSGGGHEVYYPGMEARAVGEFGLLGELRHALQDGSALTLHYQPKIDMRTGGVVGVEALVRWNHPKHGLLGPETFVPIAEETGLVRSLTAWVVPHALAQLRSWRDEGVELRMAVNISARDVYDPDIASKFAGWLRSAGMPGSCLVVEVTEGMLLTDGTHTGVALERLRALGAQVSLDDFGTGYSSLAYLESLSVDEIKLDRQFLRLDRPGRCVLRSIIALGHDLGMRVVAEGVENAEHAEWLAGSGCDEAQGLYFCEPLPAAEAFEWLRRRSGPLRRLSA